MIHHLALAALAIAPMTDGRHVPPIGLLMEQDGPIGDNWLHADGGIPVDLGDGRTLYMFGDTFHASGGMSHNSAIVVDESTGEYEVLDHPQSLIRDTATTWFWPSDAVLRPTGELVVIANELTYDSTSWFGFRTVDTDAFVVRDPTNVMSWRLAEHVDEGWWDGYNVAFLDQDPTLAVVRRFGDDRTYLFDTVTETLGDEVYRGSHGVLQPIHHEGYWWAVSWEMAPTGAGSVYEILRADSILGPWTVAAEGGTTCVAYGHALHIVAGEPVLKWSNACDGLNRPTFRVADLTRLAPR